MVRGRLVRGTAARAGAGAERRDRGGSERPSVPSDGYFFRPQCAVIVALPSAFMRAMKPTIAGDASSGTPSSS